MYPTDRSEIVTVAGHIVLLIRVGEPHRTALAEGAESRGGTAIALEEENSGAPRANLSLCAVGMDGRDPDAHERVRKVLRAVEPCPVVVLAESVGTRAVIRLIRAGVADVVDVQTPPRDLAALVFRHARVYRDDNRVSELVGQAEPILLLRKQIAAVASTRSTVLILGETGTGKGLVARAIHRLSSERKRVFVHVDCAALSPALIESELFGHERGAFTGATDRRVGRFELADDGTIFLDEIGDLQPSLQAKLLRVLQDHQYERVGGARTLIMRARVIAATSRDLRRAVHEGRFRRDLYFRLNVLQLQIPPLRERRSDIPLLVRYGLDLLGERLAVPVPEVSDGFYERLAMNDLPGNVRELMNVLERCLVHRRVERLEAEDLDDILEDGLAPASPSEEQPWTATSEWLARVSEEDHPDDRALIRDALIASGGNVSRVARRLGLARTTLRRRIREYDLGYLIPQD